VLLGTLLTAVLVADVDLREQRLKADERIAACAIADDLLATWTESAEGIPREAAGDVTDHAGWRWRTTDVADAGAFSKDARIVRIEILAPGVRAPGYSARVEVLLPRESDATTARHDAD